MIDATDLSTQRCRPLEGQPAMSGGEITRQLARAPGWALAGCAIQKRVDFADFHRTMAFVDAAAWVAHVEDHHPELVVSCKHCLARFDTHSVGGISINDFICAAKVDALLP